MRWNRWWERAWQPRPAFRSIGVRDERCEVSDCRLCCHLGHSWGLYREFGAEVWAAAAGVEGRGEKEIAARSGEFPEWDPIKKIGHVALVMCYSNPID